MSFAASLYILLGSLLVATNSFHLRSTVRVATRKVKLLRPFQIASIDTFRSCQLRARKSKRGGGDDSQDGDEAKWDDNLADTENQMILHGEDDIISTDEWSSETSQIKGRRICNNFYCFKQSLKTYSCEEKFRSPSWNTKTPSSGWFNFFEITLSCISFRTMLLKLKQDSEFLEKCNHTEKVCVLHDKKRSSKTIISSLTKLSVQKLFKSSGVI